jgi:hypothetical protein
MLTSMIQRKNAQIFQRENVKNGIHKKLKIVLSSSFKVYSELGSLRGRPSVLWGASFATGRILAGTGEDLGPAGKPIFHDYTPQS